MHLGAPISLRFIRGGRQQKKKKELFKLRNIKEIIVEYSNEEEFNKEVTRRLNNFCSVCDRELTKEQAMESRRLLREGDGLIAPSCYECRMKRDEIGRASCRERV